MNNIEKGDVSFVSGGETYHMRLDMNAIITIQQQAGANITEVFGKLDPGMFDPVTVRMVAWAMLLGAHPEITVEQAGRLFPANGVMGLVTKMQEAIQAAFPTVEAGQENPQTASR